jgi:Ca2+-binding EF-hand superfamily protein
MQTHRQRLQSRFGLETASDGSGSVNTTTPHYARGFAEKKGDTEEEAEAKKKKVTGTTVTTLPAADLRFLKLRRRPDSECNVPITFDRDEKLREMFTRLDHEGRGFIYLKELKEASEFVEKRMKATKELVRANGAKSLYQVFQDMDTNHDGFLTNNEFVNAMTGTRRGAFENLSEDDIEQVRNEEGE